MASTSGVKAGRAWIGIEAVDRTAAVMKKIGAKMKAFAARMGNLGRSMILKGAIAAGPLALSVKVFASFDDAMKKVEARSSGTAAEIKAVREEAKLLGRTTSFTARQVAELQAKLAQKNFDRPEIKEMTKDILNLAKAAGEGDESDTVVAADLVTNTIRAFRLEAKDAVRITDVFSAAVNGSAFSLESLKDGMSKISSLAKGFNISLEETVATLASMTNVGVTANEAGTALKSFLAKMSKTSFVENFNNRLQELTGQTVQFKDAAGNLLSPLKLLQTIGEVTANIGTADRGDLLSRLFGVQQFGKATAGAAGATDALELLDTLLNKSQGSAARTAKKMDSGIGGSFRKLLSAVEGLEIAIGEALGPTIKGLADFVAENTGELTKWIEVNKGVILTIGGIIAGFIAAGIALVIFGTILSSIGTILGFIGVGLIIFKSLLLLIISPVGLLLIGLVAVIKILFDLSAAFRKATSDSVGIVTKGFGKISDTVTQTMKGIVKAIGRGDISEAWDLMTSGLELVWLQTVDVLHDTWANFSNFFIETWSNAMTQMQKDWIATQNVIAKGLLKLAGEGGVKGAAARVLVGKDINSELIKGDLIAIEQQQQLDKKKASIPGLEEKVVTLKIEEEELLTKIKKQLGGAGIELTREELSQQFQDQREKEGLRPEEIRQSGEDNQTQMRANLLEQLQIEVEIKDIKKQVEKGIDPNSVGQALNDMAAQFDATIANIDNNSRGVTDERRKLQREEKEARQQEIAKRTIAFEQLLAGLADREAAEEELDESLKGDRDAAKQTAENLRLRGMRVPFVRTELPAALEKGTIAAAQQAFANTQTSLAQKAFELAKEQKELAEKQKELQEKQLLKQAILNDLLNVA